MASDLIARRPPDVEREDHHECGSEQLALESWPVASLLLRNPKRAQIARSFFLAVRGRRAEEAARRDRIQQEA